jgi:hypothetical protein
MVIVRILLLLLILIPKNPIFLKSGVWFMRSIVG